MLKQSSSRMKRVRSIFFSSSFCNLCDSNVGSADHDHGHWWHHEDLDRDHL